MPLGSSMSLVKEKVPMEESERPFSEERKALEGGIQSHKQENPQVHKPPFFTFIRTVGGFRTDECVF